METNNKPKNPQAFPVPSDRWDDGMTLRDYFANSAMQVVGTPKFFVGEKETMENHLLFAKHCYQIADAMLKQREL